VQVIGIMTEYAIKFPTEFDDREPEYADKGYLAGVRVAIGEEEIELTIYDQGRLEEEVRDEIERVGFFSEPRVVVVDRVARAEIEAAVERLAAGDFREVR
jgi:hypothetical protein